MLFRPLCAAALAAAAGTAAGAAPCFEVGGDGATYTQLDGYDLSQRSAAPGLMARPPLADDASGLVCVRETIVPRAHDFEALYYVPLYLAAEDSETILALGHAEGRYVYQIMRGDVDAGTRARIQAAVEGFNDGEAALRGAGE